MAKDTYKATERRLYALPILREKLQEDKEKLEEIRTHGTPQHSKGIVRYSRTGIRLSPEEILDGIIKDMEATIAADQYEIDTVEKALSHVKDDPFYSAIEAKYFEGLDDEDVAEDLNCGTTQLILSRLVDTFISKISLTMLPVPNPHNTACVLSWEEARRWQSRSSGYSSS